MKHPLLRRALPLVLCAAAIFVAPANSSAAPPRPFPLGGGMGIALLRGVPLQEASWFHFCTLTAIGHDKAGNLIGITSGHCAYDDQGHQWPGDEVLVQSLVSAGLAEYVEVVGTVAHISGGNPVVPGPNGVGLDYAVILFDPAKVTAAPTTARRITAPPPAGTPLCKEGISTGRTCGVMTGTIDPYLVHTVSAIRGDSGAPILAGDALIGSQWIGFGGTAMTAILADLDQRGGLGAGFQLATD
ncbi:hypothetical protein [Nocardia sp. NPDC051832]|uniref:hypothetical protein n=1 Tax=Nocardia sp. NPDC051832 TaxID=3155673 RepID=UPI003437CE12